MSTQTAQTAIAALISKERILQSALDHLRPGMHAEKMRAERTACLTAIGELQRLLAGGC